MAIYCCIRIRRRKASKISHPSPMYNEKDTDREFRHEVHSDTIKRELAVSEQALATELPGSGQDKGKSFLTPPDHNLRIPVELPETTIPKPVYELMSRQGTGSHQFKPRPSPLGDPIGDDARSSPSLMASSPAFTPISPSSWRNSEHSQIVSPMASNPPTPHQRHFRHNTHSNAPDTPPIFAPITVPNSYFPPREGTPAGSVRGEGSSEVEPDPEATDADSIYSRETTQTGYSSTLYPAPLRISRQIVPDRPR